MSHPSNLNAGLEPSVDTIQIVCDRLADLGLVVGPDVARDLIRAVLAAEAPRLDARIREALTVSLETVRVAAQSALGMLKATAPGAAGPNAPHMPAEPAIPAPPPSAPPIAAPMNGPLRTPKPARRQTPAAGRPAISDPPPFESRRPIARRGPQDHDQAPPPAPPPDRSQRPNDRDNDLPDAGGRPVFKRPRGR